jgi:type II secretory pathway component PulJ
MTTRPRVSGLALLEVLVALVLLSLLVVGYLRLFQGGHRLFARSEEWSEAVRYATDAMERAKTAAVESGAFHLDELPAGWGREVSSEEWEPGVTLVTVTVTLPDGGALALHRLRSEAKR